MKDRQIYVGGCFRHDTFGILRVVGSFREGERGGLRTVYDCSKPDDQCNYNAMAYEFLAEATEQEWAAQATAK